MKDAIEQLKVVLNKVQIGSIDCQDECIYLGYLVEMLTENERLLFWEIVDDAFGDDTHVYVGFLSMIYKYVDTSYAIKKMIMLLCDDSWTLSDLIAYEYQIRRYVFAGSTVCKEYHIYLYEYIVKKMKSSFVAAINRKKTSTHAENKKILLVTSQLLDERHSPSFVLANLYYYLNNLEYEVKVLVLNKSRLMTDMGYWWSDVFMPSEVFQGNKEFVIRYFQVIDVEGYQYELHPQTIEEDIRECVQNIVDYNPALIIDCGGDTFIPEIFNDYYPVAFMGFTSEVPPTTDRYILRYFNDNKLQDLEKQLQPGQRLISCLFDCKYMPQESPNQGQIKLIGEDGFKVAIVGNRLNEEVSGEFESLLLRVVRQNPQIIYIIIGDCDSLQAKYDKSEYRNNFRFVGYTLCLEALLKHCNLFLNAPRTGGGGGAVQALKAGVPVLTLGDCDVASVCGLDFICDSLKEMEDTLLRYCDNDTFMIEQRSLAEKRYKEWYVTPETSEKNIKQCILEIQNEEKLRISSDMHDN